jgi:HNH endonuclease
MRLKDHAVAAGIALLVFLWLTIQSAAWGLPSLIAAVVIALACTALYFHYRRRVRAEELIPVTPEKDDRVIPRDVRTFVIARDGGKCQIQNRAICLVDSQIDIDHKIPYEWGGSSKDPDNLQCACGPCNRWKSNRFGDTPSGRITREEYMRMTGRKPRGALV